MVCGDAGSGSFCCSYDLSAVSVYQRKSNRRMDGTERADGNTSKHQHERAVESDHRRKNVVDRDVVLSGISVERSNEKRFYDIFLQMGAGQ